MSGAASCKCKPRDVEVMVRNGNYSAFSGWRFTPSDFSQVRCRKCGAIWRSKAAYVSAAPDAPRDSSGKLQADGGEERPVRLTEKELDDALRAANDIGIVALKAMKVAIPRLVADLRAARAALYAWIAAQDHRYDWDGGCEVCEGSEPCPEYDALSSGAVVAREAALPKEEPTIRFQADGGEDQRNDREPVPPLEPDPDLEVEARAIAEAEMKEALEELHDLSKTMLDLLPRIELSALRAGLEDEVREAVRRAIREHQTFHYAIELQLHPEKVGKCVHGIPMEIPCADCQALDSAGLGPMGGEE